MIGLGSSQHRFSWEVTLMLDQNGMMYGSGRGLQASEAIAHNQGASKAVWQPTEFLGCCHQAGLLTTSRLGCRRGGLDNVEKLRLKPKETRRA